MKTLLLTIGIGITTAYSSFAGPSWGFTLGNGAGFSWNGGGQRNNYYYEQPRCMPRQGRVYREAVVVGPQYYRMHGNPGCGRIKNYMNAPIVVNRGRGGSVIIPRSWD
jgi:hypothetical protein